MQDLHLQIAFWIIVPLMLILDLFFVGEKNKAMSNAQAIKWSCIWISLSFLFAGFVWWDQGVTKASEFLTAYMIEKALSVDNLFVFVMVFSFFNTPDKLYHKILYWGIIGAIIMRAIFIFTGTQIINMTYVTLFGYNVNVVLTLFGAFLVYAGIKAIRNKDEGEEEKDFSKSPGAKLINKLFGGRVLPTFTSNKFIIKQNGVRYATLALVVLAVIEFTDLLFAVDSIPAIFSVSKDPFILYSSNIFAILGLRALFFLLNNFIKYFTYLPIGLGFVLAFIGTKMVISPWYHIESTHSLIVISVLLTSFTLASWIKQRKA